MDIVTPDCQLTWQAPIRGGPVAGYMVYLEKKKPNTFSNFDAGPNLYLDCSAASITPGIYRAWVKAYNIAGESRRSDVLRFRVIDKPPAAPQVIAIEELQAEIECYE